MLFEHIGISVADPLEMADWYEKNLGFTVKRRVHKGPGMDAVFIQDESGKILLEILSLPGEKTTAQLVTLPAKLHYAFLSDDPYAESDRLQKAGAVFVSKGPAENGEILLFLKDPWDNYIQLVKRAEPLI